MCPQACRTYAAPFLGTLPARSARVQYILADFCSCACCWQDTARSFYSLGIIDVRKDDSICDALGSFATVLFGAF